MSVSKKNRTQRKKEKKPTHLYTITLYQHDHLRILSHARVTLI